ncbi:hypothetical protein STEG23_025786, partial [Scotinomys teguina]
FPNRVGLSSLVPLSGLSRKQTYRPLLNATGLCSGPVSHFSPESSPLNRTSSVSSAFSSFTRSAFSLFTRTPTRQLSDRQTFSSGSEETRPDSKQCFLFAG